jgi:hypothetical protein
VEGDGEGMTAVPGEGQDIPPDSEAAGSVQRHYVESITKAVPGWEVVCPILFGLMLGVAIGGTRSCPGADSSGTVIPCGGDGIHDPAKLVLYGTTVDVRKWNFSTSRLLLPPIHRQVEALLITRRVNVTTTHLGVYVYVNIFIASYLE